MLLAVGRVSADGDVGGSGEWITVDNFSQIREESRLRACRNINHQLSGWMKTGAPALLQYPNYWSTLKRTCHTVEVLVHWPCCCRGCCASGARTQLFYAAEMVLLGIKKRET